MSVVTQSAGQLEYRAATEIGVSFPDRTVDLIVMPYERETVVEHEGRLVREVISRGAFNGIQRRSGQIKVNRDHDVTRVIGRCVKLYPNRDEGLVAEVKISDIPLGDETLTLANDGVLDISAGFMPLPGGERWEERSLRRVSKAYLAHIAFVPEPAYEDARVLAVRSQGLTEPHRGMPRPNLDRAFALRLNDEYNQLIR